MIKKLIVLLLISNFVLGQNYENDPTQYVSSDYHKNSLTTMLLKYGEYDNKWQFDVAFDSIDFSPKYFKNEIGINLISQSGRKQLIDDINSEIKKYTPNRSFKEKIKEGIITTFVGSKGMLLPKDSLGVALKDILVNKKVANKIIKLWAKTSDDKKDFVTLMERSESNLTVNDLKDRKDHKKLQVCRPLFDRNYILLFDFGEIMDGEQFQDQYTFSGGMTSGLYDFATEVNTYVYRIAIDDPKFEEIKYAFDNFDKIDRLDIPLEYVGRYLTVATAGYKNREHQDRINFALDNYRELAQNAYNEIIELIEINIEDFKVKTMITDGFPGKVKATIGKKQNLKIDQRYYVYQYEIDEKTGKNISKLKGTIRASSKIADNNESLFEHDGTAKKTVFNQISGGILKPGMFIVQENDFGIAVNGGVLYRSGLNFNLRGEYNISQWIGKVMPNWPLAGTKFFLELFNTSIATSETTSKGELGVGYGLSTTFYLNKWIRPEPFVGYYGIGNSNETFFNFGVRSAYPVKHNIFVVPELIISSGASEVKNINLGVSLRLEL